MRGSFGFTSKTGVMIVCGGSFISTSKDDMTDQCYFYSLVNGDFNLGWNDSLRLGTPVYGAGYASTSTRVSAVMS